MSGLWCWGCIAIAILLVVFAGSMPVPVDDLPADSAWSAYGFAVYSPEWLAEHFGK